MARPEEEKLKLGKGAAFVKSRISRLPESGETWESDFEAPPKPMTQTETHYLGMVVAEEDGALLAELSVHGRPSVNDLATFPVNAMRRPLDGPARRPRAVHLRGHRQWRELVPVLEGLDIGVAVQRKLPGIQEAFREYLRQVANRRGVGMVNPSPAQAKVEAMFPAIARYVAGYGYSEVGDQVSFGFVVRAIGYGGVGFDDDTPETLAEAMTVLEAGLARLFKEQGTD